MTKKQDEFNAYDKKHLRRLSAYQQQIDNIFNTAAKEAAAIGAAVDLSGNEAFTFADYPLTHKKIDSLLKSLARNITLVVVNGIKTEWDWANSKNDELVKFALDGKESELLAKLRDKYFSSHAAAKKAFLARRVNGLSLSERVWNYTEGFKEEIEMGLDLGIREGKDAASMAMDLKQYLRHPDTLFRRVRDEYGILHLSKRAKTYHPGRGVYRSSYKNARRLAATETNMAYRTADYERWQDLDFVVGIEISLSNNHTCLGADGKPHPFHDVCDELAGRYPKDFKFTGWHPHCRCRCVPILMTEEELMEGNRRIMRGEELSDESENMVEDVPQKFKDWLKNNQERAKRSTSVPYFVSNNEKYLPDGYKNLYALKTPYATYAEYEAAMRFNKKHADFTPEVIKNNRDLDQALPVMHGRVMNFTEADQQKVNPHFSDPDASKEGYWDNCQTCTMTYELRRRGFPVEALPNKGNEFYDIWCPKNNLTWNDRFLNPDGSRPIKTRPSVLRDTITAKVGFIEDATKETGRYELYLKWKPVEGRDRGSHVMIVERQKDDHLLWFDPQSGEHGSSKTFNGFMKSAVPIKISVLRIDDKIINPKFAERLKKASE